MSDVYFVPLHISHWGLVDRKLGIPWIEKTKGILACRDDQVIAGCVLQNWTHSAVEAHFWIDSSTVIRRGFFEEVANYVFNVAGMYTMVGKVPADNEDALRLDTHMGFKELARIPDGYRPGEDLVILTATRKDLARWLPEEEDGQERRA